MKRFVISCCLLVGLAVQSLAATLTVGYGTAASYIRIQTGPTTYVAADCTVGSGATAGRLTIAESTIAALSGMTVPGTYPFVVYTGTASTSASDTAVSGGKLYWDGTQDTGQDNSKLSAITWATVATVSGGTTTGINVTTSSATTTNADYGVAWVTSISSGDPPALTDNYGNRWEVVEVLTEGWVEGILYECKNPRTGTGHTLTATSAGKLPSVFARFFTGVRLSGTHTDQADSDHTFSATTQVTGPITPTENNCLCLVVGLCAGGGTPSVNDSYGYTSLAYNSTGAGNIGGLLGTKVQTTAASTTPTVSQSSTGSIGAAVYSLLPHVAGTRYITINQWQDKQVLQRDQNSTKKLVSISGKYYGTTPTSIEIQDYKWRAAGSVGLLQQDYTPVSGLVCSSGTWSGQVSIPQGGWLRARARSKDSSGNVLATGLYTNNRWGVGANYLVVGQSNGYKLFQDFGLSASDDDLTAMVTAGAWSDVTGDGACALANALSAKFGFPVGLLNYAVPGAGIVYDAGSGEWQSQSAGKPWPLAQAGISAVGGDIEGVICQGCEADAENPSFDADALKDGFDTLYGRIVAETPRTTSTLPFYICIPGPLNDPATTDAKWDTIRTTVPAWADATDGAVVAGSLADGTLADAYHFGGVDYAHNGHRIAQSILYHNGLADNSGRSPQIFKSWRFSGSPIVYVQLIGLGNSGICEADGTTDGGSLTGFQVSDDAWATTETISSTAIEGNVIKLTLAATPTDGATVVVRNQYGKTPTITNLPYRNAFPQGDTIGLPIAPSGEVSVELRTAFDPGDNVISQATLAKEYPIDFGYTGKTASGAVAASRATTNITLLSETETSATVSTYTTQTSGALVWDNGALPSTDKLQLSGSSSSLLTDSDFENVPDALTWKLVLNSSSELVGDKTRVLKRSTGEKTFAVDFAIDLPVNGKISTVNSVSIDSGTAGGVTFGTDGRERNLAKVRITGVTVGTYVIAVEVTDSESNPHTGKVTLKVVD